MDVDHAFIGGVVLGALCLAGTVVLIIVLGPKGKNQ